MMETFAMRGKPQTSGTQGGEAVNAAPLTKEEFAATVGRVKGWLARRKAAPEGSEERKALLAERPHLLDSLIAKVFPALVVQHELSTAIHEAGHAVIRIRCGGKVRYVELTEGGGRCCHDTSTDGNMPDFYRRDVLCSVAGHFAAWKWGFEARFGDLGCGANSDFMAVARWERVKRASRDNEMSWRWRVSKQDRITTRKVWRNAMRRLHRFAKRDPTIEAQVMAVAAALVVRKRLEGDEVEAIMRGHLEKDQHTSWQSL